jgi:hypothetical protein
MNSSHRSDEIILWPAGGVPADRGAAYGGASVEALIGDADEEQPLAAFRGGIHA